MDRFLRMSRELKRPTIILQRISSKHLSNAWSAADLGTRKFKPLKTALHSGFYEESECVDLLWLEIPPPPRKVLLTLPLKEQTESVNEDAASVC